MLRAQLREPAREVQKGEFASRNEKQLLVAAAKAALCQARSGELRAVSCDLHQGVLTLRGQVPSYYLKQVAQEVIRAMAPGEQVKNHLHVVASANGGLRLRS
ncbi:MAG TPA: BON domain-containing protein [Candidatus Anammoximicrobium sp.]|nr:BON domain-containing protein [Candidatus Anammoximicrobium sp.]